VVKKWQYCLYSLHVYLVKWKYIYIHITNRTHNSSPYTVYSQYLQQSVSHQLSMADADDKLYTDRIEMTQSSAEIPANQNTDNVDE